ncbi:hypothetical protein KRX11_06235 [Pasteurellaceae bacterium TAE3-ERU1]|nr:hypothetical protein [Pasteurellaceae bacterium TAE3-ERU1]
MHPIIKFYLDQEIACDRFDFNAMLTIPKPVIGDGYFYIAWLFPTDQPSKWNHREGFFTQEDIDYFRNNEIIQQRFLQAFDFIIDYFSLYRKDDQLYAKESLKNQQYWLRNIGHESKKISRIIYSLWLCGQPELARNLQRIAIELGKEKGHIQEQTIGIWQSIIPS